ncbi:ead/Ea22-like family protein [Escherichia coli]|uniref:EaD protein n=2 Tax=Aguilavirus TaxID=2843343 RepID=K7PHN2_9CAUD|nr:ead/Ea22-like family protein [Escherichia coli]YP_007111535.1 ead/Ea22-like family protein [Enterobacteria phage mEp043 c-1]YP_007112377.1 ead/Ea22-like family protein [Enterobacteria phage mEp213]AFM76374.1 EaD protein [Enterobacteria phage mEp213]AFM76446.1 EaD protein [Enterobacteria phage mEp043 c-1]
MSNIDKQALREIAAAAVGAHERLSVMPPDDIFDISLAEGTQLDADITALNALNSAANPTTVLALLDELEKMQAQSSKWCEAFHKAVSVGARYEERIAKLEAKLDSADKLQDSAFRHGLQHGFSLGQTDNQAGFEECLSAYGTGKGE